MLSPLPTSLVVLSLRPPLVVLHKLVVASPLVAPPSHPLVVPPSCPLVVLSLRCPLVVSSHQLVVASPLVAPPSHQPLTLPLLLSCAGWLLHRLSSCRPLVVPPSQHAALSLCRPLVLSLSSHCATLSLSHLIGWLLRRLLLHRPLIALSLRHSFVVLRQLVVALPLVVPPSCPLVVPPSHPLVTLYLKLVKPGFPDPFDATFEVPRERSSRTSPAWPLALARWSRRRDQTSSMNRMLLTLP